MEATKDTRNVTVTTRTSKQLLYSEKFEVLSRVQGFLPKLATANEELKSRTPEEVNIENVDVNHEGPLIEMNFALVPSFGSNFETSSEESDTDSRESDAEDSDVNLENVSNLTDINMPTTSQQGNNGQKKLVVLSEDVKK